MISFENDNSSAVIPETGKLPRLARRLLKLRHASVGEIGARIKDFARVQADRRRYNQAKEGCAVQDATGNVKPAQPGKFGKWIFGAQGAQVLALADRWSHHFEELESLGKRRAEVIANGQWTMLGHSFDLNRHVDWHRDPRSTHQFPRAFYADAPLCQNADDEIDVKYVWELGRHQFLVELARGWLFSRVEHFAEQARALMLDWIDENPLYEGVHWTSALEVAMRSISWIWTLATSATWNGWQAGALERIITSLAEHAKYLAVHLSFYSSPYNHLIGEATALYLISLALEGHPQAGAWREKARAVLLRHGPRQFYSDGFCVEQATGYHFYTLGFLTMAISAARDDGAPLTELEPHVHRAYRAGVAFRQPSGRWPAVGDVDSARSIPVHHDDYWEFDSLCHVGAVLFQDPVLKVGREPGEELFWLLGCEGLAAWHALPSAPAERRLHLVEAGYVAATDGKDWLLLDAGPIAAGLFADSTPSTAHGHLDTLQVLYCANGEEVLVDGGMPHYFRSPHEVRHFRGPAAHNTFEIEGIAPAREAGRLAWSHVRQRPKLVADLRENVWAASAQVQWQQGMVAERHVLCIPGAGLWIADWLELDRSRKVRWRWQVSPETELEMEGSDMTAMEHFDGQRLTVHLAEADIPIHAEVFPDFTDTWIAPTYGAFAPSRVYLFETHSRSLLLLTAIQRRPLRVVVTRGGLQAGRGPAALDSRGKTFVSGKANWWIGLPDSRAPEPEGQFSAVGSDNVGG